MPKFLLPSVASPFVHPENGVEAHIPYLSLIASKFWDISNVVNPSVCIRA